MVRLLAMTPLLFAAYVQGAEPSQGAPSRGWLAGKHYQTITPVQPTHAATGKIEVIEIFSYGCNHCDELEPHLSAWLRDKPGYIQFSRVPVPWHAAKAHARLFYTLEALNRSDLHQQVFDAIFRQGNRLTAADDNEAFALQLQFAKAHGIPAERFTAMYQSPMVEGYLRHADEITRRYKIMGVPTIVINGKYLSDDDRAGGKQDLIALTRFLAEREWKQVNHQTRSAALQ